MDNTAQVTSLSQGAATLTLTTYRLLNLFTREWTRRSAVPIQTCDNLRVNTVSRLPNAPAKLLNLLVTH